MTKPEQAELCGPGQRPHQTRDALDVKPAGHELRRQAVFGPAPVVRGMRMIQPRTVGRQEQPAVSPKEPPTFTEVPVKIPYVLEDLEGHDAVRRGIRQRNRCTCFDLDWSCIQVTADILTAQFLKQRAIRHVAATEIDDDVFGFRLERRAKLVFDLLAQADQRVALMIPPIRPEP